jgi:membrane protease YdiL (CAAX protease family)
MLFLFFNERRLRAGWRIALFFAMFMALSALVIPLLAEPSAMEALDPRQLFLLIPLLLASWVMTRLVDQRPVATLGVSLNRRAIAELAWGMLLGAFLIGLVFGVFLAVGAIRITRIRWEPSEFGLFAWGGLFFLGAAVLEELLLRGYLFQTLLEGLGIYPTLIISSVLFSAAHLANPNISQLGLITIALAGLLFSVCYLKTRALWMPIGVHAAWNFFEGHVFSLPVSGLTVQPHLFDVHVSGALLVTGGAFGPEGSLVTALVLGAATAVLLSVPLVRPDPGTDRLWKLYIWPAKYGGELP